MNDLLEQIRRVHYSLNDIRYPEHIQAIKCHPKTARELERKIKELYMDLSIKPRYPLIYHDRKQIEGTFLVTSEDNARAIGWPEL